MGDLHWLRSDALPVSLFLKFIPFERCLESLHICMRSVTCCKKSNKVENDSINSSEADEKDLIPPSPSQGRIDLIQSPKVKTKKNREERKNNKELNSISKFEKQSEKDKIII